VYFLVGVGQGREVHAEKDETGEPSEKQQYIRKRGIQNT